MQTPSSAISPVSAMLLVLCVFIACPSRSDGQTPGAKQVHCSMQKAVALTEADRLFLSGDAKGAEALFAQQLTAARTFANFSGVVKSQLEQNKLTEALASARNAAAADAASADAASADAESLVGDVLMRSGDIPAALAAYRKALDLDQCSARAHFGYGRLNELNVAHATAAHELLYAHKLAPNDAEITAAYLDTVPAEVRLAGLQTLLSSSPALPPAALEKVQIKAAILEKHKVCLPVSEFAGSTVELLAIELNGTHARSWGLRTRLNNLTTPLLELDTSVSGIVLNREDAEKAGVHPLLDTPASPQGAYTGFVDRVRIGDLDYHDCPVRVVPDSALAGGSSVIGTDFFRNHLIHIDYVALKLTLSPLPARPGIAADGLSDRYVSPGEKDWSPVYIAGPGVLLPTFINKQGPFLFMMDTGITRSVLSPAVTSNLLSAERDNTLNLEGTSSDIVKVQSREGGGDVFVTEVRRGDGTLLPVKRPVKLPVYHFTNNEVPDTYTVSFDLSAMSHQTGTEVSGLLGFGILRSYYLDIDYRDGLARVLFDQNRSYELREEEKFH